MLSPGLFPEGRQRKLQVLHVRDLGVVRPPCGCNTFSGILTLQEAFQLQKITIFESKDIEDTDNYKITTKYYLSHRLSRSVSVVEAQQIL